MDDECFNDFLVCRDSTQSAEACGKNFDDCRNADHFESSIAILFVFGMVGFMLWFIIKSLRS